MSLLPGQSACSTSVRQSGTEGKERHHPRPGAGQRRVLPGGGRRRPTERRKPSVPCHWRRHGPEGPRARRALEEGSVQAVIVSLPTWRATSHGGAPPRAGAFIVHRDPGRLLAVSPGAPGDAAAGGRWPVRGPGAPIRPDITPQPAGGGLRTRPWPAPEARTQAVEWLGDSTSRRSGSCP